MKLVLAILGLIVSAQDSEEEVTFGNGENHCVGPDGKEIPESEENFEFISDVQDLEVCESQCVNDADLCTGYSFYDEGETG